MMSRGQNFLTQGWDAPLRARPTNARYSTASAV